MLHRASAFELGSAARGDAIEFGCRSGGGGQGRVGGDAGPLVIWRRKQFQKHPVQKLVNGSVEVKMRRSGCSPFVLPVLNTILRGILIPIQDC